MKRGAQATQSLQHYTTEELISIIEGADITIEVVRLVREEIASRLRGEGTILVSKRQRRH